MDADLQAKLQEFRAINERADRTNRPSDLHAATEVALQIARQEHTRVERYFADRLSRFSLALNKDGLVYSFRSQEEAATAFRMAILLPVNEKKAGALCIATLNLMLYDEAQPSCFSNFDEATSAMLLVAHSIHGFRRDAAEGYAHFLAVREVEQQAARRKRVALTIVVSIFAAASVVFAYLRLSAAS